MYLFFQLFSQVTQHISLPVICDQYHTMQYYDGIVELALSAAARVDPQNLAFHFYQAGQPLEDSDGLKAMESRYIYTHTLVNVGNFYFIPVILLF